jgi:hypothetical protein
VQLGEHQYASNIVAQPSFFFVMLCIEVEASVHVWKGFCMLTVLSKLNPHCKLVEVGTCREEGNVTQQHLYGFQADDCK